MLKGIMKLLGIFSNNLGIDLGTANTVVYMEGKGIVLYEPSIVSIDTRTGKVLAVGKEAKEMLGKTPEHIQTIRPLKDGVITDFEATKVMLSYFIRKALGSGILKPKPRVVIGVPSGVTQVEKRAVLDAAKSAGAREVFLIAEPMAAALGAGLPVEEPVGNMIVDIGGGTTEIAVISLAGIVVSTSIRIAGDEMTEAIIQYIKKRFHLLIGEQTAEKIKVELGSAIMEDDEREMEIRGRDMTGLPKTIRVTNRDITEALEDVINAIINAIRGTLEKTPPELASDIADRGIVLAGGGSLLRNMDVRVKRETGIDARYCEDPLTAVARGVGLVLDKLDLIRKVAME
ncbi:cell shape determining protein, MreB/Mrl family [Thermocrinis albus DSM 14484]|uniref:Cell shape-determining protein MreB n=1 Tax=Thermocrinis albus (strain DSM 14484 / JCM 11386 / HI 11/12) TaxID=638303 RepID=D3SMM5_THEAH|nr:rod shape-determining protein [Thermocrinis albus]ADC90005.1 cell shape determining protein, MreB/Mrl family [Thermocrinis albus DSM 14484]